MEMTSLRQLEIFRAVMISGSTSGAALLLQITQPAVSRALVRLEADLSLTLFDRSGGRLQPTMEGRMLFNEVERSYSGIQRIWSVADKIRSAKSGQLQIAVLPAVGTSLLPRALSAFNLDFPGVDISLRIIPTSEICALVQDQMLDFGIVEAQTSPLVAEQEEFSSSPLYLVVRSDDPVARLKKVTPRDLAGKPFVTLLPGQPLRNLTEAAFEAAGVPLKIVLVTQTNSVVCETVANGLGIGLVDLFSAFGFRDRGLKLLPFEPEIMFRSEILYPRFKPLTKNAKAFLKILRSTRQDFLRESQTVLSKEAEGSL